MKTKGILILLGAVAIIGCDTGDTAVQTYQAVPGQVTNPSAPPAQASTPKDSSEAVSHLPPAARDALMKGRGGK